MEKNKIMMIAIMVLLVVLLVTIGVGFFITLKNLNAGAASSEEEERVVVQEDIKLLKLEDSIYTNLRKGIDGKDHIIKVSLSLGIDNTKEKQATEFIETLIEKEVIVMDVAIGVLRNKTYEELQKSDTQEVLREEILSKLQQEFNSNLIVNVYMSDLFLQ